MAQSIHDRLTARGWTHHRTTHKFAEVTGKHAVYDALGQHVGDFDALACSAYLDACDRMVQDAADTDPGEEHEVA